MKNRVYRFLVISQLVFLFLIGISACDDDKPTNVNEQTGVVSGFVVSVAKNPLSGVTVRIGTKSTTTDADGYYVLSGIAVGSNVMVNFAKAEFASTQKVAEVQNGRTTHCSCTMFNVSITTFDASSSIILWDSGGQIEIPANAFKTPTGAVFSGQVLAELKFFDPTLPGGLQAFPGNFSGIQTDNTEVMFESYGFLTASFYDLDNPEVELQLISGKTATIMAPIPLSLILNAPAEIPMWYYDTSTGKWMEQGEATRIGNSYQGSVSHFSYWNFDHPVEISDQATITGKVVMENEASTPVAGAQVIATGINYSGYTRAFSDSNGDYSLTVKANSQIFMQAFQGVNSCNPTAAINTPAGGGTLAIANLLMNNFSFTITGKLLDADLAPYPPSSGLLFEPNPSSNESLHAWLNPDAEGNFSVQSSNTATGSQVYVVAKLYANETYVYSNRFSITIPSPGQVVNLGNVIMHQAGFITGRAKDSNNVWLANTNITFIKDGIFSEGNMMQTTTDDQGNFSLPGPAGISFTSMVGSSWIDNASWETPPMTLNFPSSGQSSNIGTIVFSPAPTGKQK